MPESAIKFGSYEVSLNAEPKGYLADPEQGSRRMFAKLEGHDDPKNLAPWSQFFAAGMGGIISQYVLFSPLHALTLLD